MSRRAKHPAQRALIPAIDVTPNRAPVAPPRVPLRVTFIADGVTHVRYCPSRIYYDTMLTLAQRYCDDAHGSLDPPAPVCRDGRLALRSAQ